MYELVLDCPHCSTSNELVCDEVGDKQVTCSQCQGSLGSLHELKERLLAKKPD
jgi:hypothetical protein